MSPMQRSLAWLREHGYEAQKVEYWNHYAKRRVDLWGIDILAMNDNHLLAVQTTDGGHHAEHVEKILASPAAKLLAHHARVEIWSWSVKLTRERRGDGLLDKRKRTQLRRDNLTARLRNRE
jgi:hypothetical protein